MEEPVVVKYIYNQPEIARIGRAAIRAVPLNWRMRWLGIVLCVLTASYILMDAWRTGTRIPWDGTWNPFLLGVIFIVSVEVVPWSLRRQFSKSRMWQNQMTWKIVADGMSCECGENGGIFSTRFAWKLVRRVADGPVYSAHGCIFYGGCQEDSY